MFEDYSKYPKRPWRLWGLMASAIVAILFGLLWYSAYQQNRDELKEQQDIKAAIVEELKEASERQSPR